MTFGKYTCAAMALVLTVILPAGSVGASDAEDMFAVDAAYAAVTEGDLETAVSYLTEDAVFAVVPASSRMKAPALVGREEIRNWWAGTHKDNGRVEINDLAMDGVRATFTCLYYGDKLEKLGVSPAEFDGAAVLRDGKIRVLVWSYTVEYEPRLKAALAKIAN